MSKEVDKPLLDVLHSGYIGQGPQVDRFEQALCDKFDFPNVLTVNSGTSALQLALRLAGVGPGDEVITTPQTCSATNLPILATGATPVWADIDPFTGNISPNSVARMVSSKTKAVMGVAWGGLPVDFEEIRWRIPKHIALIEDAAHALGARRGGKYLGADGTADYTCFSFQAIKHLTTVDGGALVCKDPERHEKGKLLRWYGIDRNENGRTDLRCENDISDWGYKFHMNDVAATIGLANLEHIDMILARHCKNAQFYDANLTEPFLPCGQGQRANSANWLYTMRLPTRALRDEFMKHAADNGVHVSKVHARNDFHSCLAHARSDDLSGVEEFESTQVSIPVHWALAEEERDKVLDTCLSFAGVVSCS